jgi:LytR cell envelope-related transcriptional attenuator
MSVVRPTPNPAARGAAIVLVALAIGVAVLLKGFSSDSGTSSAAVTKPATTTTSLDSTATSPTTPPVTPSAGATKIVVANGSLKSGAASKVRDTLNGKNYTVLNVANVTPAKRYDLSSVYYTEGFDLPAKAIATALGVKSDRVKLLPGDAPAINPKLPATANVLVLVGVDLAGK